MAKKQLDVYRDWLGIQETARPLNYYQLLKLKQFEDDVAKIRGSYRQFNAHVRRYSTGEYGPESQRLLNELTKAMLCLTDVQRKREYDITLGRKEEGEGRRLSFEESLLAEKVLTSEQLNKARNFAKAVGMDVRDAVLQQKLATPEAVMQCYAQAVGLPYLEVGEVNFDQSLVHQLPGPMARQHSCLPVMVDDNQLLVASPNPIAPAVEDQLRLKMGLPVRSVLCTPRAINELIGKFYSKEAMASVAEALAKAKGVKGASAAPKGKAKAKADDGGGEDKPKQQPLVIVALIAVSAVILFIAYKMFFS